MNIIHEFTLKSLKRNKKRTVVTIIGVVISAAMLTAVTVFVSSLLSMIQRSTIADGGNWHAQIRGVPAQNIHTVTQSEEVDTAVLSRDLGYAYFGTENESRPYLNVRELSAPGFDQMSVRLVSGRLPQKSGEAVISSAIEKSGGVKYAIGDTLELEIGKRIGADGVTVLDENTSLEHEYDTSGENPRLAETFRPEGTLKLSVVGVIDPPSFESSWSAGYGVIGSLDETALAPDDAVDIFLTAKNVNRGIFDSMPNLAAQAGASGEVVFNNELLRYSGVVEQDNVFSFIVTFLAIIILIIILASVSLIYNAFAISVSERAKQLGLLASIGATKQQKRGGVYFEGFFIGAIGIPIGIAAGIGGIGITIAAIQPLLDSIVSLPRNVTLTMVVPPLAIIAAVILSAVTIFVSAWIPAKRASKITPIDAIRMTKEVKLTRHTVKTSGLTRALFGFEAEIALKNLKRSRKKYRATIISLVISLVLFLTVSTYTQLTGSIAGAADDGVNFDIAVQYSTEAYRENIDKAIASLKEVKDYTVTRELAGVIPFSEEALTDYAKVFNSPEDGQYRLSAGIISLQGEAFSRYAQSAGLSAADYMNPDDPKAILINHGQDYYPTGNDDLKKVSGDVLTVQPGQQLSFNMESMSKTTLSITVGAVTEQRPMGTVLHGFTSVTAVVSEPVFDKLAAALTAQNLEMYIQYNTYLATDSDQQVEKQIIELTQGESSSASVWNVRSAARSQQNMQLFLGIFVYGFIILISLICIANIFNTVTTNIALRRREFAMLRSVGMTPKSFGRMIRFESVFYGVKGLLYGLPISVVIAYLLFRVQRSVLETSFTLPWMSYAVAIVMILIIVLVTMWYASSKIKKENIMDALKEENT